MSENNTFSEALAVQWFPGHMAKAVRMINDNLKLVDLVLEIRDARVPESSKNPEIAKLIKDKPKIVMLNKSDCADEAVTKEWLSFYSQNGIPAFACDCKSKKGISQFTPLVKKVLADLLKKREEKGMQGRMIRIMVVGIPNVGKSSFINAISNTKKAKVEDRPGVTRNKQWVRLEKDIELLDMPGVLWPKFEDPQVGEKLAFTGAVKDDILDIEFLACRLLSFLAANYADRLCERYKITLDEDDDGYAILEKVGRKRGMLISGGEINTERAAIMLLDEYRGGKLGRITFERPEDGFDGN